MKVKNPRSQPNLATTKKNIFLKKAADASMAAHDLSILLATTLFFFLSKPILSLDFIFNSFSSSSLLLYGNSSIDQSSVLTLTSATEFAIGRALYPNPIPTRNPNSSELLPFSTSFIFSISPLRDRLPGHGFTFLFAPTTGINGTNQAQHLGLLNFTNNGNSRNRVFAVEFDLFRNEEFNDISDNHVGVNVNSLTSVVAVEAGYWSEDEDGIDDGFEFREISLNDGENYQVWIDYLDSQVNISMGRAGMRKPIRPLINVSIDLSNVLLNQMYVGFSAATGQLVEYHRILSWSFSNSNSSIGDALITSHLPSFVLRNGSDVLSSKGFIIGIVIGGVFFALLCVTLIYLVLIKRRRKRGKGDDIEKWEVEYWPHRIDYQEVYKATKGFADENVIGCGRNGKVYKGVMTGGIEVAVKRVSVNREDGVEEFLAEISSLGRLKHRNLVGLRGWCKTEERNLILVYDYMENGSLDKWIFQCENKVVLNWEQRVKVIKDVACGVLYLHEEWEVRVLHRDIKASNVLLDKDMNARLGDFGLARMHNHGKLADTTRVVGTVGYMAPEVVHTGRASAQTDVFGFGVLVLEVVTGRRPVEEEKLGLVDWVYGLMRRGKVCDALDERLKADGGYNEDEVEKVLLLGLRCVYPEPNGRPSMRMVLKELEGKSEGEWLEVNSLEEMGSSPPMWFNNHHNINLEHPSFEDIHQSFVSSFTSFATGVLPAGR